MHKLVAAIGDLVKAEPLTLGPTVNDLEASKDSPIGGDHTFYTYFVPGAIFQAKDGTIWHLETVNDFGMCRIRNAWYPREEATIPVADIRRSIDSWIVPVQQKVTDLEEGIEMEKGSAKRAAGVVAAHPRYDYKLDPATVTDEDLAKLKAQSDERARRWEREKAEFSGKDGQLPPRSVPPSSVTGSKSVAATDKLRPFTNNDWMGFAGVSEFPDGSQPMIGEVKLSDWPEETEHMSATIIVGGDDSSAESDPECFVQVLSVDGGYFWKSFKTKEEAVRVGETIASKPSISHVDLVHMGFDESNFTDEGHAKIERDKDNVSRREIGDELGHKGASAKSAAYTPEEWIYDVKVDVNENASAKNMAGMDALALTMTVETSSGQHHDLVLDRNTAQILIRRLQNGLEEMADWGGQDENNA
jgi:hypothetical protein